MAMENYSILDYHSRAGAKVRWRLGIHAPAHRKRETRKRNHNESLGAGKHGEGNEVGAQTDGAGV